MTKLRLKTALNIVLVFLVGLAFGGLLKIYLDTNHLKSLSSNSLFGSPQEAKANDSIVQQQDSNTNMQMPSPRSTLSIEKVRQWYDLLGTKIDIERLQRSFPNELRAHNNSRSTLLTMFTAGSCQVCVGEIMGLMYEMNKRRTMNVVALCFTDNPLFASPYKPMDFPGLMFLADTSKSHFPKTIHTQAIKPIVLLLDNKGVVLNAYLLQEKDMETRARFTEASYRFLH